MQCGRLFSKLLGNIESCGTFRKGLRQSEYIHLWWNLIKERRFIFRCSSAKKIQLKHPQQSFAFQSIFNVFLHYHNYCLKWYKNHITDMNRFDVVLLKCSQICRVYLKFESMSLFVTPLFFLFASTFVPFFTPMAILALLAFLPFPTWNETNINIQLRIKSLIK